jgi:signal-transduction protein with cAMP-binding, CBS, and nucleotidyltransferase domain
MRQQVDRIHNILHPISLRLMLTVESIKKIVTHKLETIHLHETAQEAAKKMRHKDISSLLVVNESDVHVGIVTEKDLVSKVCIHNKKSTEVFVNEIMSSHLLYIEYKATLEEAAKKMVDSKIQHLLVKNEDTLVGILSTTDLSTYLRQNIDMDKVNASILESLMEQEKT